MERAELRLANSLESPFGSSAVDLRLHSSFLSARNNEWMATVSLWVDAHHLTLEGPVYNRSAIVHLLVRTFGVAGAELEGGIDKLLRVSLNEEGLERAMKYGLLYSTTVEIRKPGPYQVRAVLLDQASGHIGTASQFLVVPKADKRNIALPGIVFPSMLSKQDDIVPGAATTSFAPGQHVPFTFEIIGGSGAKDFSATTSLYRDGELDLAAQQVSSSRANVANRQYVVRSRGALNRRVPFPRLRQSKIPRERVRDQRQRRSRSTHWGDGSSSQRTP